MRSTTGWSAVPIVAAGLGYAAWRGLGGSPVRRVVLVQVLGVVLALDTPTRMVHYVFEDEVVIDGVKRPSDIHAVAAGLGGSYILWGCVVTVIAVGLLALALWWAWRRPEPNEPGRVSSGRRTVR